MKILHALAQRPGKTGSGVFLQQLFKAGFEKGYQQAVLAGVPLNEQEPGIDNLDMKNYYPVLFETSTLPFPVVGMSDVMPYKSTKYSELTKEMFNSYEKEFKKVITKAVEEFKPDVVICNHIWLLATFIKDLYPNLKVLALCHGTDLRQLERAFQFVDLVKEKIPRCDYFFALNSVQNEEIKRLYKLNDEQVITSGSGYNPKMFFPIKREKNKKIKITYVGKICNAKGVPHLINAFENVENCENMELNLIGNGTAKESDDIIKSVVISKANIRYLGLLPQKELEEILKYSDIFILPSFFEGLPLVVIEALASGAKVITTDLPGLDDFLGDELKELGAIRYIKMPRLKNLDTPFEEDIKEFENSIKRFIKEVSLEVISDKKYDIDKVIKLLEDKTWIGLFNRLEKLF
ncbi:glycosyltransferase family 4 protein [Halarcobacter ebronensis]|uniref:Glycoside hydrolase n=1 Tax=Halarcobacter ebronensis TaxID=1462615 RepID=A0A4Q1AR10_9BACT|nr:glycosyltransferase family 4 protein [Halarcobacter ebronensis]QKF83155.1 glycosyltransferase, family 1 [Halarcobacter ebronensis]RXK05207.1 glycoside hydrolase [Halarcobacter ebronensis]